MNLTAKAPAVGDRILRADVQTPGTTVAIGREQLAGHLVFCRIQGTRLNARAASVTPSRVDPHPRQAEPLGQPGNKAKRAYELAKRPIRYQRQP